VETNRKAVWMRAEKPSMADAGLKIRFGDGSFLFFDRDGYLRGYWHGDDVSTVPMRLKRREDVGAEMHLVFETLPGALEAGGVSASNSPGNRGS
jgi:hypothetical protein